MGELRAGDGPILSSASAKQTLGRTTFRRVGGYHLGNRADPTAWAAEKHVLCGEAEAPSLDMELLFKENPKSVKAYRSANMTDQQIYELLKNL